MKRLTQSLLALTAVFLAPSFAFSQPEKTEMKTHVYKTVGPLAIKADVYRAADKTIRPVVIWIHGGALIMGNRGQLDRTLRAKLLGSGYAIVSIDYRLAPETKLPAIMEDLQDAGRWVHEKGPELFQIDRSRMAIMGGSAGGYLTLSAGHRFHPPPRCLVSFWGYGDIGGAWYGRPDPFYSKLPPVPKEEAFKAVGNTALSESSGRNNRNRFYLYCRQQGIWPNEVGGRDPKKDPKFFDAYCPVRNVRVDYPSTLLIHGTKDTDVPYEQSVMMDKELSRLGVESRLITVVGAGHGLAGAEPSVMGKIQDQVIAFLDKHMMPTAR
jgi:acetyl esterase/lipase